MALVSTAAGGVAVSGSAASSKLATGLVVAGAKTAVPAVWTYVTTVEVVFGWAILPLTVIVLLCSWLIKTCCDGAAKQKCSYTDGKRTLTWGEGNQNIEATKD